MTSPAQPARRAGPDWFLLAAAAAMAAAFARAIWFTPPERLQGYAQKIFYVHVPSAWVAFLAFVAGSTGVTEGTLSPALVVTVMALLGTFASVLGNEASIRFGRRRLVATAMILSIGFAAIVGFAGSTGYWLAVFLVIAYGVVVWLDSSSVTAGAAGNAEPARRGATLAVHSTLGYAGGFVGPLVVGWTLDLAGGMSPMAWGLAFLVVALLMLVALAAFLMMRPANLAADRGG